nr:caspase family protein [Dawidia soli]
MLIFDQVDPSKAQLHVLIIGVGVYPFLSGGTSQKNQIGALNQIGQLTSTVHSAEKFRETVLALQATNSWARPLGSVEMLVSALPGTPQKYTAPTRDNVEEAYNAWSDRCGSQKENIAIFYFAGHGFAKRQHHLLLEDFGENTRLPCKGSFEFNDTRQAFSANPAQTQLFFIDACRKVDRTLIDYEMTSSALDTIKNNSVGCAYDLTIRAATHNEATYGERNGLAHFTKALVLALTGQASVPIKGKWTVDMNSIATNINKILDHIEVSKRSEKGCQVYMNRSTPLITLASAPEALLQVVCDPGAAHEIAELHCLTDEGEPFTYRQQPSPDPWMVKLPCGHYRLRADFKTPGYSHKAQPTLVLPPVTEENLSCSQP